MSGEIQTLQQNNDVLVPLTLKSSQIADVSESRRTSCSSSPAQCPSPNYDSGHFSGSNSSELSLRPISYSSEDDGSGQDIRAIRSELDRLTKSERWYKNELKTQKRSKLELLEKLYVNERKFIKENQRLQTDCQRLYTLCNETESRVREKDELIKKLRQVKGLFEASKDGAVQPIPQSLDISSLQFELQRQKSTIQENENLIAVLRNQKQNLLLDLRTLTTDRDAQILEIEKKTIALECENRVITKRCLALGSDKQDLEERVRATEEATEEVDKIRKRSQSQLNEISRLTAMLTEQDISNELKIKALKVTAETSGEKIDQLHHEVARLNSSCAEKMHRNEHLEAENEQYRKMRDNFEKYVILLQGNSAELDSKSVEISQLKSAIHSQEVQIAALDRSKEQWQKDYEVLRAEIEFKDEELLQKKDLLLNLNVKKSTEAQKLRDRLGQLERLNENLIGQLHGRSADLSKKTEELHELRNVTRELSALSDENLRLEKLLEIRDVQLSQQKTHETFTSSLQAEIGALRANLNEAKGEALKVSGFKAENAKLKEELRCKEDHFNQLTQSKSEKLDKLQQTNEIIQSEKSLLQAKIQSHSQLLEELRHENSDLKSKLASTEASQLAARAELSHCRRLIERNDQLQKSNSSRLSEWKDDIPENTQILRETSQKVPETTCDRGCQATATNEIGDLRLLHRVVESEHRKQIARYELHIRTMLGKIRSYRERDAMKKKRELNEYEHKIKALRQQLDLALRRAGDVDRYKILNLQLQTNLSALTGDYKRLLLAPVSPKSTAVKYDVFYELIDKSNKFVPNCDGLSDSIDGLKNDLSRLKMIIALDPNSNEHPVKRLSLMDELRAAGDGFSF